jgi:glutathionyl-hydroquinone reductase
MGMLVNGIWFDDDKLPADGVGRFVRPDSIFRDRVTRDGLSGFKAEAGRYQLVTAPSCPWAHRTDLRLFPTLVRFDTVYYVLFKCNRRRVIDYHNLWNYTREIYQMPGVAETVDFLRIKLGYYGGMRHLNNGILPLGPELDFAAPHDRGRFAAAGTLLPA